MKFITIALIAIWGSHFSECLSIRKPGSRGATPALPCNEAACSLPDCYCSTTNIPGSLPGSTTPQIVTLTFIGNVPASYYIQYDALLRGRTNPNGCPISATFFATHDYSDYPSINKLATAGHEIAVNTISGAQQSPSTSWTIEEWANETAGMRTILDKFGLVDASIVTGSRAPYFQHGGNIMAEALYENKFAYDSSIISYDTITTPVWPYTMDYLYSYDCFIKPCVVLSYPGLWEHLITFIQSTTMVCETLPGCTDVKTAEQAFNVLVDNLNYHSAVTSRAPYNIVIEASWFATAFYAQGLAQFLDYVQTQPDIYVQSVSKTLEWVKNPTPLSNIGSFEPWQCSTPPLVGDCSKVYNCYYPNTTPGGERYVNFCSPCPPNFPWVENPNGL
ncbi:Cytidine deaminase 5 [Chamberlinius hualienensis]